MQTKISSLNKIKIVGYALGLMSLVVATQLTFAPKAEATTYNVTPSSACTLEDALASAATDAPVGSCDAGDADDTINVGAGTYTLSADLGVLVTPGNISIIGESATSTIIDGADFAGLTVAAPGNYLIESLTLQNFTNDAEGNGLIVNVLGSNVVANKLIVKDNICADSIPVCAITVTYSDNNMSTTISNSTFTNNTAFALFSNTRVPIDGGTSGSSVMNIFNNTIYDNNAALLGTVNAAPDGTSTTNFYNNTVAQNTPYTEFFDLAFIVNIGEFEAYYPASLNLRNNIFYGNTLLGGEDGNCANLVGENGTVTSDGGNISSDATCNSLFTSTNDKNSTDPLLGAYQQVGSTFVMPLQAGSPALENAVAGTPATPSIDQRGVARPQAALADSGAYEYVYPTPDSGGGGGSLAGTGWDAKTPALVAGILVLSGILAAGYALKRR
jgi:hypothetical protein